MMEEKSNKIPNRIKIPSELIDKNSKNDSELVSRSKSLGFMTPDDTSKRCDFCNKLYRITLGRCSNPKGYFCEYNGKILKS